MKSRRLPHPRALRARLVLIAVCALIGVAVSPGASRADAEIESLCGPFDMSAAPANSEPDPFVLAAAERGGEASTTEPGITAASSDLPDPGQIVRLPVAGADGATASRSQESEAILALPKNDAGQIPEDFELGAGARIRESFFSPVICATIARIAGPAGATLEQLVTVVPEGSALVANDVYASAAAEGTTVVELPSRPDPYSTLQYGLAISGVRDARELSNGEGVTIALLDSAPEFAHQDLARADSQSILVGVEGETPVVGVHGTLMAGVMTAIEGNGFGIAGLAPGARLVSIPICTPSGRAGGRCTIFQLLKGLDMAWNAEAKIVNLSLSGPPNILLERGVARLEELGAVVVAAAGNEGTDQKRFPAAYPTVIGVGATDREGRRFEASNRGAWVELSAPGVNVLSTVPGNAFAFGNGTSLAAAHVTGVLAVVTGVTGDPKRARTELFRAAHASGSLRTAPAPNVCDVLARFQMECGGTSH